MADDHPSAKALETLMSNTAKTRLLAGLPWCVNALLLLAVAWLAARIISLSLFDTPASFVEAGSMQDRATSPKPAAELPDIRLTASLPLFGTSPDPSPVITEVQAPETRLDLHLRSIVSGRQASAVIARSNQPGRIYTVGMQLPGTIKVAGIMEDRVILERDGNLETLKFTSREPSLFTTMVPSPTSDDHDLPAPPESTDPVPDSPDRTQETAPEPVSRSSLQSRVIEREAQITASEREQTGKILESLSKADSPADMREQKRALNDLGALLTPENMSRAGLRPTDQLLSVNGHSPATLSGNPGLIREIIASKRIEMQILRDGKETILILHLR